MRKSLACYPTRFGKLSHNRSDRTIGRSLQVYGEWAPGETALLKHFLKEGQTVLDIGANIGYHTQFFANCVGKNGRVLAFEPFETNFDILKFNILINNLENVKVFQALVDADTSVVFDMAPVDVQSANLGATSYDQVALPDIRPGVESSPLMKIAIDSLSLQACDLFKIDVEGMELAVLRGAAQTITRLKPVIFYEQNTVKNFHEIQAFLSEHGYVSYWSVTKAFPKFNIRQVADDLFKGATETNILALPKEKAPAFDFLNHLIPVTPGDYTPPALSALPDDMALKANKLTQVDVQWIHFLNAFLQS